MKIAFITSHINKSLQWNWFSEELIDRNISHIHIIINDTYPMLADDMKKLGIPVFWLSHKNIFSHIINLLKVILILNKHKIDIIHSELPYGNLIGQLAGRVLGIKKRVVTCENATWGKDNRSSKHNFIDRFAYKSANKVVALTDLSKQYLCEIFALPEDKVVSIGHAIKIEDYENITPSRIEKVKQRLNISENDFIVGTIARFEEWKGHKYIIDGIGALVKEHPNIKLHIFGSDGPERQNIFDKVKEENLSEHVFYHGFIDDPICLYRLFDVHVHVPVSKMAETFGITVIEGMISGCTQVLTRSGVSHSSANDMVNSLVVDYCNGEQIAAAILKIKNDPELAKRISQQAMKDAIENYVYKIKAEKHLQLYAQL